MGDARLAIIGFGEAAQAFAADMLLPLVSYDDKIRIAGSRKAKLDEFDAAGVKAAQANSEATSGSDLILSLVSSDQALSAAVETAAAIGAGALFCDMNSVAPDTKRAAARPIGEAGGRYVDVAVMSPVHPAGLGVPLLVAGPHAVPACDALAAIGFKNIRVVEGGVGAASSIKMIRSVMVKGLEALSAECAVAARAAGVLDEVVASLNASWPGADWARRLDYNLDRMMVHGTRRAAEMREAAATVAALGVDPVMTRGTIARQRALGALEISPPVGLDAKLVALEPFTNDFRKVELS